jgi:two-component system chemotaxis response regulator CheB
MSLAAPSRPVPVTDPVRVIVVDDSVVARGLIARWIDEDPALAVVGTYRTGKQAVDNVAAAKPDVIVLDIEMPEMDGLTALPLLLKAHPTAKIVMASTLTRRNAEISMKALSLGATDYLPKPDSNSGVSTSPEFRRDLVAKVKAIGEASKRGAASNPARPVRAVGVAAKPTKPAGAAIPAANLRRWSSAMPRIVAIGSSTGGPQALATVMRSLGPVAARVPIVITQHMPATFTSILAENLGRVAGLPSAEGQHGEALQPGHIYVAPGGKHMVVRAAAGGAVIELDDGPPVNFCKPAVDPMFQSIAQVYGPAVLAAVLTGMGNDGGEGAVAISDAGGSVIAQDEASSVVWGMPQAVVQRGACAAVLPLTDLGAKLAQLVKGGKGMTPADYDFLRSMLKERSGLVLSNDKQYLIESRLMPIAREEGLGSISELVVKLRSPLGRQVAEKVVEAMTTNESFFFRDKTPFDHFSSIMLPKLMEARKNERKLRIWCAAASTGQEPYSLAMLIKEMGLKAASFRFDILGTDLSREVLERAKAGRYSQFEVQRGLPIQLLLDHFEQQGDVWQLSAAIRQMVQLRPLNLLDSFSGLGSFDIVFIRNVLIYFDQETKADILERVAKQMAPDGYMVLGAAETVVGLTGAFKPVEGARGLYQPSGIKAGQSKPAAGTTTSAFTRPALVAARAS